MPAQIDTSKLHPMARKALDPSAPPKLRAGAARGLLPGLPAVDVVTVVALLAEDSDKAISSAAAATLGSLPTGVLNDALTAQLPAPVLDTLARHNLGNDELLVKLIVNPGVDADTVAALAERGSEALCERIATNEQRLLTNPVIVEKLYMNKNTRMSTADRVLELAVRNGLELNIPAFKEAATAIKDELILEPTEEPTPDDILFQEVEMLVDQIALDPEAEDVVMLDDEGNEIVSEKCQPIWTQIAEMTVSQKIRRALLGTGTERMLLVRDTNRLVAAAAIRSPKMKENEVAQISASRSVSDEVLRIIANNREWTRNHQVKFNLVSNPRTPFTFAAKLIPHLREHELKSLAKSKNVTGAVATAARQHLMKKDRRT